MPEEEPHKEKLAFLMEDIREKIQEKESIGDFSCSSDREEETNGKKCKAGTGFASEAVSESAPRKCVQKIVTKLCSVVLEDISCDKKVKHKYGLLSSKARKRSPKTLKGKTDILKKIRVILADLMKKNSFQQQRRTLHMRNAETPLANELVDEKKKFLEQTASAELLSSGTAGSEKPNSDDDLGKHERGHPSSTDLETLCEQGIFARLGFVSSNERDTTQPKGINLTPASRRKTLEGDETNSVDSSDTFESGAKFSQISVGGKSVSSLTNEDECHEDPCQAHSNFEPCLVPSLDVSDHFPGETPLTASTEGTVALDLCTVDDKQSEEQGTKDLEGNDSMSQNQDLDGDCWFFLEIGEAIELDGQVPLNLTEEENKFKGLGDVSVDCNIECPQAASESISQSLSGDITVIKPSENEKAMMPRQQEVGDGEVNGAEEDMTPQPAKEDNPMGEEESLQSPLIQGVQTVFYKFSGTSIKLLGPLSDAHKTFSLGRCRELEDSSDEEFSGTPIKLVGSLSDARKTFSLGRRQELEDSSDEERQDACATLSLNSWEKEKLHSGNKFVSFDGSKRKARKKTRRPNKPAVPTPGSLGSQEQTRMLVADALRETLQKRLDAFPELRLEKNTVSRVAKKVEREIFRLFGSVGQPYKNKYRSLLFNLKSDENQQLFCKVILGEITPRTLVQMNSFEMAPKELAEWRTRENRRVLEIIEKEEREAPQFCSTKFTHKGIVEINREVEKDLTSQEILELQLQLEESCSSESSPPAKDAGEILRTHSKGCDCFRCAGQKTTCSKRRFKPSTCKATLNQEGKTPKHLHSSSTCLEGEERPMSESSPIPSGVPEKSRRLEKQSKRVAVWKGLIQMFSIKQFMAEAYPVSGSSSHLSQDLPLILQSRGCVPPEEVWAYLDSIWPANSKEMGVICFHPTLSKSTSNYKMLYTYLNSKQRYGVVATCQVELFVVPLASYQPVPSRFHPLGGPGLDPSHSSLLLGLILPKRPDTGLMETGVISKRKTVSPKKAPPTCCFSLPSCSQGASRPTHPRGHGACEGGQSKSPFPREEPFTVDTLLGLTGELGRRMLQADASSRCQEVNGSVPSSAGAPFLPLSGPSWAGEQLGGPPPEIPGAPPFQGGGQAQPFGDPRGLLLPSEIAWPDQPGPEGVQGVHLEAPFPQSTCWGEAGPPAPPFPPILSSGAVSREPALLVEEAMALLEQVTQLQSQIQGQDTQLPSAPFSLPIVPQEVSSVLSQCVAELELLSSQQEGPSSASHVCFGWILAGPFGTLIALRHYQWA